MLWSAVRTWLVPDGDAGVLKISMTEDGNDILIAKNADLGR